MKKRSLALLLVMVCLVTEKLAAQEAPILYSFFVAGHTYGQPGVDNVGLHPPFKEKFDYIKARSEIMMGFLTGDIVKRGSVEDWDEVDADVESLGIPVYFAAGNHDMSDRELFESRYGKTFYAFKEYGDLFIVLDPNLDNWNISGEQLLFLNSTLNNLADSVTNIFVFFHQMLWWAPDNIYSVLSVNSHEGRAENINFWTEIEPLFKALDKSVFMFCGDVGAGSWATDVSYDRYGKISLIASGMGEGPGDNFVVVNVHQDKSVSYDLICLNHSNLNCLGNLMDYRLSTHSIGIETGINELKAYPNPSTGLIYLPPLSSSGMLSILDLQGRNVLKKEIKAHTQTKLDLTNHNSGLYFLHFQSKNGNFIAKLILHQ